MTEAEWLASADVDPMFIALGSSASPRKLRLFAVACCRRQPKPRRTGAWGEQAEDTAEWFCDGAATPNDMRRAQHDVERHLYLEAGEPVYEAGFWACSEDIGSCARRAAFYAANIVGGTVLDEPPAAFVDRYEAVRKVERQFQCELLRDIFGNPFRPVAFDPAWRTDTAVILAKQVYERREFSALPILADALQDAGCENEDVLLHLRDAKRVHVRGCWVLDLVLNRE